MIGLISIFLLKTGRESKFRENMMAEKMIQTDWELTKVKLLPSWYKKKINKQAKYCSLIDLYLLSSIEEFKNPI